MSQDKAAEAANSSSDEVQCTVGEVITPVVEDCLYNIVHDTVLQVHRTEKLLRMSSAATQISIAAQNHLSSPHSCNDTPTKASANPATAFLPGRSGKYETPYATYHDRIISLKGNPLATTPQIFCPKCRLPRLLFPLTGAGSQVPEDINMQYCSRHPYVSKPGHDMYGNPFPSDHIRTKKERELLKQQERAAKDSTPASQNSDPNGEEAAQHGVNKLIPQGKGANYIPWHTCPRCKRSLLITRFAQHLEKCLGISGRQSSRNAMAKLTGQNGSIASTPIASRPGTPAPGSMAGSEAKGMKRDRDEDEGDEADDVPLKKVKKRSYIRKADRERLAAQTSHHVTPSTHGDEREAAEKKNGVEKSKILLKMKAPTARSPSKDAMSTKRADGKPGSGKRDRDKGDGEESTPKKKMKLTSSEGVTGVKDS